jgi:hypothetical protein
LKKLSKKLSRREIILGYITLLISILGFVRFVCNPQYEAFKASFDKVEKMQTKIEHNNTLISEFEKRSIASLQTGPENSPMNEYVLSSQHLAQIIDHLITDDKHLITRMIRADKSKQEKDHTDISFKVELVGSFMSIGAFIERLENSRILAQVSSVDVMRVGSDLDKCIAKIDIDARLFRGDENE